MSFFTASFVYKIQDLPPCSSDSCPQLTHRWVEGCTAQFPHLIFLNKFFPVSKGISSQITNTKLNSSFHSKFISKDEFCSQINHWNTGWIHKKTLRIWIEFKGLAGYVSQEMLECGREGQEKPLQKIQIKELSLADKSGCKKDSPSLRSSGFWSCL